MLELVETVRLLEKFDDPLLTSRETRSMEKQLRAEIVSLWQTRAVRKERLTVLDEVRNGLYFLDEILFDVLPGIHLELGRDPQRSGRRFPRRPAHDQRHCLGLAQHRLISLFFC